MGALNIDLTAVVSGLLVSILIGVLFWRVSKTMKEKGLSLKDYINQHIIEQHVAWMLVVLFFICISEGVLAASIPTDHYMNGFSRFLAHLSISLVGVTLAVSLPKRMIEVGNYLFSGKKVNPVTATLMFIELGVMGLLAVLFPYWNLTVIAIGLHEYELVRYAFMDLFYDLRPLYIKMGLGANYNPVLHFSYQMYASWILMFSHYGLALLDGLYAARFALEGSRIDSKRTSYSNRVKIPVRQESPTQRTTRPNRAELEEGILVNMIAFATNLDSEDPDHVEKINEIVGRLTDAFNRQNIADKLKISKAVNSLYQEIMNAHTLTRAEEDSLRNKILNVFQKSPSRGGFGVSVRRSFRV